MSNAYETKVPTQPVSEVKQRDAHPVKRQFKVNQNTKIVNLSKDYVLVKKTDFPSLYVPAPVQPATLPQRPDWYSMSPAPALQSLPVPPALPLPSTLPPLPSTLPALPSTLPPLPSTLPALPAQSLQMVHAKPKSSNSIDVIFSAWSSKMHLEKKGDQSARLMNQIQSHLHRFTEQNVTDKEFEKLVCPYQFIQQCMPPRDPSGKQLKCLKKHFNSMLIHWSQCGSKINLGDYERYSSVEEMASAIIREREKRKEKTLPQAY